MHLAVIIFNLNRNFIFAVFVFCFGFKLPANNSLKTDMLNDVLRASNNDQFSGSKGKKFKNKQLTKITPAIDSKSLNEQKTILLQPLEVWKGNLEQVDDVCILGVKI